MTDQQPHTPSTEQVRDGYSRKPPGHAVLKSRARQAAEFDRWHDAEIAAAKAEAYREAQQIIAGDMTIQEQRSRIGADKIDAAYLIQEFDIEIQELQEGDHD